jgi:hypothetical protein
MEQFNQFFNDPRSILLVLWALAWKGYALWRAAKNDQKYWYIAILVINLLGILEIVYLFFFQKEDKLWNRIFKKA